MIKTQMNEVDIKIYDLFFIKIISPTQEQTIQYVWSLVLLFDTLFHLHILNQNNFFPIPFLFL
jgi:hypothetical protein